MQSRYIIVGNGKSNSVLKELFRDVIDNKVQCAQYINPYIFPNAIVRFLYRAYYCNAIRTALPTLPNCIWRKFSSVNHIKFSPEEKTYIIYVIGRDVDRLVDPKMLKKIKNKYGEKVSNVLLLMDSIDVSKEITGWGKVTSFFQCYDKIVTFDINDSQKYGLIHITDPYSKRIIKIDETKKSNLFFIGEDKQRSAILYKIAEEANKCGLACNFLVWGLKEEQINIGFQKLHKYIPYEEMLEYVMVSDCLVEVLAEGQSSSSLRYYEAVVYNKKLITNNKNILKMPFYNEDYIQYFESPEDIDYEWIKNPIKVDYAYNGEFSVNSLLKKISEES